MSAPPDPTPQRDVSQLRAELDELDARSLEFLARRRELVREVVRTKSADGKDVRDPLREEELLERLIGLGREQGLDAHFVTKVFREIIADSVRLQVEDLQRAAAPDGAENGVFRVACQGGAGAYSELAAKAHFSTRTERLASKGFQSFAEAAQEVEEGRFDYAILPIENTTTGSINEVAKIQTVPQTAGKWNTFEITADGDHLVVQLNGQTTVDARSDRHQSGPIALQYNGAGQVRFRNIKIKTLE